MVKCELCGKDIKGENAKSMYNYHHKCYIEWATKSNNDSKNNVNGEEVENATYN